MNPDLNNIFWWGAIVTIVGARLGHCLFYDPVYYLTHPIELLYFRQGGMASHGAAIGLLLGLWGFSRHYKLPMIWSLDRVMIPVTVGGAIVRFGNLVNSEIYGHATDLPWGFIFVRAGETVPKHPTQIYEALCYLATYAVLLLLYYKMDAGRRRPGLLFGVGLIGVFLSRFLLEFLKNNQVSFESDMIINMGQILSIPFIVAGILMVVWPYTKYKLTPSPSRWSGLREYKEIKKK
jgi:prolipoprotein diacylglyceryl transferase